MLTSQTFLYAMNGIYDDDVILAGDLYFDGRKTKRPGTKQFITVALAAALILSVAIAAYASNLFGLRELFFNPNRGDMPIGAAEYILSQSAEAEGNGWHARVTETYCDESTVLLAVQVSADDGYIIAPTDEDPGSPLHSVGLPGEGTLGDYARREGKSLLFTGVSFDSEPLGLISAGQRFENTSPREMTVYFEGARNGSSTAPEEITCRIVVASWSPASEERDEDPFTVERVALPVKLADSGSALLGTYAPSDPYAVPGLKLGELTLTQTPLGIGLRLKMTAIDPDAAAQLLTLRLKGVAFHGDGSIAPGGFAVFGQGQGDFGEIPTVQFLDWDKNIIAEVSFQKIG